MPKPKRVDLGEVLKVPKGKVTFSKPPEKCEACGGPFVLGRGYGYCETCMQTTPMPVGVILSRGRLRGKHVYLKSAILREIREDYDLSEAEDALEDELGDSDHIVIDEF